MDIVMGIFFFQTPEHHAACLEVLFESANSYDDRTN